MSVLLLDEPLVEPQCELQEVVSRQSIPRRTAADLLHELGDIPAHRVRMVPAPGTANENDLLLAVSRGPICELIDCTLVEKAMGTRESFFAGIVFAYLWPFVRDRKLGICTTADAMFRMIGGNIREPDVAFTRRDRLPSPFPQVGGWCPDLCIEVLSPSNTRAEMQRKRNEYFSSGCRLVWEFEPKANIADVYNTADQCDRLTITETLKGGDVLPGFQLSLSLLFSECHDALPPE